MASNYGIISLPMTGKQRTNEQILNNDTIMWPEEVIEQTLDITFSHDES